MNKIDFAALRDGMVDRQVAARGVRSHLVLDAMRTVPREAFLPERRYRHALYRVPWKGPRRARVRLTDLARNR